MKTQKEEFIVSSPIGHLKICVCQNQLRSINKAKFDETYLNQNPALGATSGPTGFYPKKLSPFALSVRKQIEEYFQKKRKNFNLTLEKRGTQFENKLWEALRSIPYGKTKSYGEIARQLNKPNGARAVGRACANNPFLIVTPCHRVVSKKDLGGFALGLKTKKHLLRLEGWSN